MNPPQTLKRSKEDFGTDDDEYETFSKKSRYLYTYKLKSPDLFQNVDSESSEVYTNQSNSTIEVADILDFTEETNSSESDCEFDSQNSSQSDDSCSSSSPSDQSECEVVTKNNIFLDIEKGNVPDDTDLHISISEKKLQSPAIFKKCCKCQKPNSNHYFQYCNQCFQHRLQIFESTANRKPKSIKRLRSMANRAEENYLPKDCQDSSSTSNSQESLNSLGVSGLCLSSQGSTSNTSKTTNNCNICCLKPKNGIFNHGNTAHVYCCYTCAKQIWSRSGRCPICNLKIRYVTKAVHA